MTQPSTLVRYRPSGAPPPRSGSEYARLSRQVGQAGLLQRRRGYYAVRMTLTAALLSTAVAAFVAVGESWWQLLLAPVFAILFTQVGFLGHDAGHRQIFGSRKANDVAGLDPLSFTDGLSHLDTVAAGPSRRPASPVPEGI